MTLHFVGFGQSNAWCVKSASQSWTSEHGTTFEFDPVGSKAFPGGLTVTGTNGKLVPSPLVTAALDRARRQHGDAIALSFCFGNHYNAVGLLEDRCAFELLHPEAPAPLRRDGSDRLLPWGLAVAQIRSKIKPLEDLLRLLVAEGTRVIHVDGPPPTSDPALIEATVQRAVKNLPDARSAPPEVRRRLWLCQRDAAAAMCRDVGATHLVPPASVMDDDGFLLAQYAKDGVHGNGQYGRHMLEWIERTVMSSDLQEVG